MESKTQKVKFEAYTSYHEVDNEIKGLNIGPLLDKIRKLNVERRIVTYFGIPVRIDRIHDVILDDQTIRTHSEMRLIYFHVTKMRDEGAATTQVRNEELTDLELSPGEYIAEDISCIYDTELNTLFVQRNFHSLSITGLCEMFKHLYNVVRENEGGTVDKGEELDLQFRPVADKDAFSKANASNNYRSLVLKFANNSRADMPGMIQKLLGGIGEVFGDAAGAEFGVTISAGNRKNPSLPVIGTREVIEQVGNNKTLFSSAIVRGKQGDAPVEAFDLLKGKICVTATFSSVRDENGDLRKLHLNPDAVESKMTLLYLNINEDGTIPFRERIIRNL